MSVQSQIDRINQNVANAYTVLEEAGADMPTARNTNNMPSTAASIKAVLYSKEQSLTEAQKAQARKNVGAASHERAIIYVEGNSATAGTWTGDHDDISSYFDGLTIAYKTNIAGASGGTTLNINGLGAVPVNRNASTAVTTIYPVGSVIILTYSGGAWLTADYDANSKNTAGTSNKSATKMYLVGATSQTSSGTTTYTNSKAYVGTDDCLYSNGAKVLTSDDKVVSYVEQTLTEAQKAQARENIGIAASVCLSLTKKEFSELTSENVVKHYGDGIREIFIEDGYTNLVPTSIGENGAIYYGCGYRDNYRLTSSGELSLADGACVSGYMPYSNNAIIRVVGSTHIASAGGQYIAAYDAAFNLIGISYTSVLANETTGTYTPRSDGFYELTLNASKITAWSNAAYFRVSCASCVGSDLIVTINEEIGLGV